MKAKPNIHVNTKLYISQAQILSNALKHRMSDDVGALPFGPYKAKVQPHSQTETASLHLYSNRHFRFEIIIIIIKMLPPSGLKKTQNWIVNSRSELHQVQATSNIKKKPITATIR